MERIQLAVFVAAAILALTLVHGQDTGSNDCECIHGICSRNTNNDTTCLCDRHWQGNLCNESINECSDSSPCTDPNSECVNTNSNNGYECPCKAGYDLDTDGNCQEILLWQDYVNYISIGSVSNNIEATKREDFDYPFPFYDFSTVEVEVSSRGYLELGRQDADLSANFNPFVKSSWPPWPFVIAPYWTDKLGFDFGNEDSEFYFYESYRYNDPTADSSLLDFAKDVVRQDGSGDADFDPLGGIAVTWRNLIYGLNYTYGTATFQVILATDFQYTYAIVVWHNLLNGTDVASDPAIAAGHSNPEGGFESFPANARSRLVKALFNTGDPTGDPIDCSTKRAEAIATGGNASTLIPCPCTLFAASQDFQFIHEDTSSTAERDCYEARFMVDSLQQQCCYDKNGILFHKSPDAAVPIEAARSSGASRQDARDSCCKINGVLCAQFYEDYADCLASPTNKIAMGAGSGSLYVSTINGENYAFNGWGEYVLFRTSDMELQGRTERLGDTNTTQFTALALKMAADTTSYQIYIDTGSGNLVGEWTTGTQVEATLFNTDGSADMQHIITAVGVKLMVDKQTAGGLGFTVYLPSTTTFEGLLNATPLAADSSSLDAEQWRVLNETYSLFDYTKPAQTTFDAVNNHTEFEPLVLPYTVSDVLALYTDETNRTEAETLCSSHVFCLLEFFLFGDDSNGAASASLTRSETFETTSRNLAVLPPTFSSLSDVNIRPSNLNATSLQLSVTSDNSNITYMLAGSMLDYFSLDENNVTFNGSNIAGLRELTYPQSITFLARDENSSLTTAYTPHIFLCLCEQDDQCMHFGFDYVDKDGDYNGNVIIIGCACDYRTMGRFCETPVDLCSNCYNESACDASRANGYYCDACPAHMDGDGYLCRDIDECAVNNGGCDQNCNNTHSGAVCWCRDGYETNDTSCTDINECRESQSICGNSKYCTNTDGGYDCNCYGNRIGDDCVDAPYRYPCSVTLAPTDEQTWDFINSNDNTELKETIRQAMLTKLTTGTNPVGDTNNTFVEVTGFKDLRTRTRRDTDREAEVEAEFVVQSTSQLEDDAINSALELTDCVSNCDVEGVIVYSAPQTQDEELCDVSSINTCDSHTTTCTEQNDQIFCDCLPGYENTADPNTCQDIDECETGSHSCASAQDCMNAMGTYTCQCPTGQYWNTATAGCINDACQTSPCEDNFECNVIDGGASYLCSPIEGMSYGDDDDDDWKTATICVSVILGFLCLCLLIAVIVLLIRRRKSLEMDAYSNSRYNDLAERPRQQGYNKRGSNTEMTEQGRNIYDKPDHNGEYERSYVNTGYRNDRL